MLKRIFLGVLMFKCLERLYEAYGRESLLVKRRMIASTLKSILSEDEPGRKSFELASLIPFQEARQLPGLMVGRLLGINANAFGV